MPNLIPELNSLDFSVYIGSPLQAAVQAQHAASMSQVSFIKVVGFDDSYNLRYVDFEFEKSVPNADVTGFDSKTVAFRKLASNKLSAKNYNNAGERR